MVKLDITAHLPLVLSPQPKSLELALEEIETNYRFIEGIKSLNLPYQDSLQMSTRNHISELEYSHDFKYDELGEAVRCVELLCRYLFKNFDSSLRLWINPKEKVLSEPIEKWLNSSGKTHLQEGFLRKIFTQGYVRDLNNS